MILNLITNSHQLTMKAFRSKIRKKIDHWPNHEKNIDQIIIINSFFLFYFEKGQQDSVFLYEGQME